MDFSNWTKASASSDSNGCVEVRRTDSGTQVRDSKGGENGPILTFTAHEWACFVAGAREGEFDSLC